MRALIIGHPHEFKFLGGKFRQSERLVVVDAAADLKVLLFQFRLVGVIEHGTRHVRLVKSLYVRLELVGVAHN